jgi:hypothetical protein
MGFQKLFGDVRALIGGISRGLGVAVNSPSGAVLPFAVVDQGDGTGALLVSGGGSGGGNTGVQLSLVTAQTPVGSSATMVSPGSAIATQEGIQVVNYGSVVVFLGPAGVTTSTGYPLTAGNDVFFPVGSPVPVFAICAPGSSTTVGTATFS